MKETQTLLHGVVGNGRLLALVAPTGAIEWLCMPRFDSPSLLGALLDQETGGALEVHVGGRQQLGTQSYLRNTNVLRTVFDDGVSAFQCTDWCPRIPMGVSDRAPLQVTRLLQPLRGHPRIKIVFAPRPDYGRLPGTLHALEDCIEVEMPGVRATLTSNAPLPYLLEQREFALDRPIYLTLSWGNTPARPVSHVQEELELTIAGWRSWARSCALPSFHPEAVLRSALCLKLHQQRDTGAIIAATTTSIPEALGSGRTWDYRYCWLRDAAFVTQALRRIGQLTEGEAFLDYLRNAVEGAPLQPVYALDGGRTLTESHLPHLQGFCGSGPVRIGNAAYQQKQNDLYGEVVLCLQTLLTDARLVHSDPHAYWPLLERMVQQAIELAPTNDTGIWEFRSLLRPYTFSRAMCWVAMDRGARLAALLGKTSHAAQWQNHARGELEEVLRRGFHPERGYFTQALDGEFPDASNLLLPMLGVLKATDPRFVSTLDAYERLLVKDGLMLRYRNADDFGETTSAFSICSFWWAEALALSGQLSKAVALFEKLLSYANPLGLFSEDIDPASGALLGNFPQAYTHAGLINAAVTIGTLLDVQQERLGLWSSS